MNLITKHKEQHMHVFQLPAELFPSSYISKVKHNVAKLGSNYRAWPGQFDGDPVAHQIATEFILYTMHAHTFTSVAF